MGSRSALLEDALPSVEIESFLVERVPRRHAPRATVDLRAPGLGFIERLRRRYDVAIGAYRDFEPRRQSTVEHRVGRTAEDVLGQLGFDGAIYDRFEHEYRAPVDLHVSWSWPDLPMWLSVGELSSTTCAVRLSLRSRRRLRYPKRYFNAAHAALARIEARLAP